ncbi:MAG: hypothetical protein PVH18_13250 [Chloroflexota bacterium]|jgi:hypothetical protein
MPRNPNKRRCQKSGCRNWAMRDSILCRPHRDHELGPRGGGAPPGNLNAWKHHKHVSPDTARRIRRIAYDLHQHPEKLHDHIAHLVDYFYNHGVSEDLPRTLKAIACLKIVFECLEEAHADVCFHADMDEILSSLPPERRPGAQRRLWQIALKHGPFDRAWQIRKAKPGIIAGQNRTKQVPVHSPTSEEAM